MTILTEDDLEFAKAHLQKFADSDFFPPLFEYEAVWAGWNAFKQDMTSKNVEKLLYPTPKQFPAPKQSANFRIVHQLDPLSCIAYTALAHNVCKDLEAKRVGQEISCSYRMSPHDGSFFSLGTGYDSYLAQTKLHCEKYKYILSTDISDFYNQIYSHRVRNAVSTLGASFDGIARDVESVIHSLNTQQSKGIPTGPNVSIIFSEAVLMDVDQFMLNAGFVFCRYVDDYRVFSDQPTELRKAVEALSEYLFNHHRLHLSAAKTYILKSEDFLKKEFFNHYTIAVQEAFDLLGEIAYGGVTSLIKWDADVEDDDEVAPFGILVAEQPADQAETLAVIVDRLEKSVEETGRCDLNLLKALLRRSRLNGDISYFKLVDASLHVFLPVYHDLCKALRQAYAEGQAEYVIKFVRRMYEEEAIQFKFIRYWTDWLASQDRQLLEESGAAPIIRATGDLRHQASSAVAFLDVSWVRAFRGHIDQLGDWDRRAVVSATRILSRDERKPMLANVARRQNNIVDELLIDYVIAL